MTRARFACACTAALVGAVCAFACVDGKTPDCSTPASGCFPGENDATTADASDSASDDGTTDAKDAAPIVVDASDAGDAD